MFKRGQLDSIIPIVAIVAVVGIVAMLVYSNPSTTGAVSWSSGGKTDNTPCARECTKMCINGANLPISAVDELNVDDCITQCLQARCNQRVRGGQCDANVEDGCCNVFAVPGQDPDCIPCIPNPEASEQGTATGSGGMIILAAPVPTANAGDYAEVGGTLYDVTWVSADKTKIVLYLGGAPAPFPAGPVGTVTFYATLEDACAA